MVILIASIPNWILLLQRSYYSFYIAVTYHILVRSCSSLGLFPFNHRIAVRLVNTYTRMNKAIHSCMKFKIEEMTCKDQLSEVAVFKNIL